MTTSKLQLSNVTLVCMSGLGYKTQENMKALEESSKGIDFYAKLHIELNEIKDIDSWNKAIIYELPKYIQSEFCLLVHHDGYVIRPDLWDTDWLDYDYCGAPWPLPSPADSVSYRDKNGILRRVGNSVSLRSKRLLNLANDLKIPWQAFNGFTNEDGFICVNNVHLYEERGMRIAPLEVAKYFSKEHEMRENIALNTFAFHQVD